MKGNRRGADTELSERRKGKKMGKSSALSICCSALVKSHSSHLIKYLIIKHLVLWFSMQYGCSYFKESAFFLNFPHFEAFNSSPSRPSTGWKPKIPRSSYAKIRMSQLAKIDCAPRHYAASSIQTVRLTAHHFHLLWSWYDSTKLRRNPSMPFWMPSHFSQ